jgi:phosphoribosylformylglycinamidine cyclo-ligase
LGKYKDSGVDVEAGYKAVSLMKKSAEMTFNKNVLTDLGSFGGMYALDEAMLKGRPVLVAGTDGVGTKLKLAFVMDRHDTVGIDCVAMCVNDVACHGARPLFFLDYIATGKLRPEAAAEIVAGMANGCKMAGCALIGGETAEMPGFYPDDEYDVAGFAVGIVDRDKIINGSSIRPGDALVGLASSGVHSNGFSLIRTVFLLDSNNVKVKIDALGGTLGDELIKPTRIYVSTIGKLTQKHKIKGIAHITGGGFYENIPRMLPNGTRAKVKLGSWKVPEIFNMIARDGKVDKDEMYNVFNMGIGMAVAVDKADASKVIADAKANGETAYLIGEVIAGEAGVDLCR